MCPPPPTGFLEHTVKAWLDRVTVILEILVSNFNP